MAEANPKRLYKFISSEHLSGIKSHGRLFIGTIGYYRVDDGLLGARNDLEDGVWKWKPTPGSYRIEPDHWLAKTYNLDEPTTLTFEQGAALNYQGDGALFCTSHSLSEGLRRRMAKEFGCDTYFRIDRPQEFFRAVNSHPEMRFAYAGRYIVYRNFSDEETRTGGIPWPWRKRLNYRWQREFRVVWKTPLDWKPRLIDVPDILPFVTFVT